MRKLRFKLDAITCHSKAMPGDYADTLNIKLELFRRATRNDDWVQIGGMGSPLGMRGPRLDIFFLPGATHRFIRTQFSAGTDLDWMLEWDVEDGDDGFYKIAVEAWNDRDVKDPYLLTRVLLAAGVAGEALPGASRSASLSRRAQQPSSRRSA